jgi:ring-1,2-phenylacetyl-CoA epoxidase subunit PaaD
MQIAVRCPHCGSLATAVESEFGPTPCRTIRYCTSCRNPFEGFKPKLRED